jgi:hypothetical protein
MQALMTTGTFGLLPSPAACSVAGEARERRPLMGKPERQKSSLGMAVVLALVLGGMTMAVLSMSTHACGTGCSSHVAPSTR